MLASPKVKGEQGRGILAGQPINYKARRLRTFLNRGTQCAYCGRKASHFALERPKKIGNPCHEYSHWHLNLYITNKDGSETMMTADHVIPKAKGGKNTAENIVPACRLCNKRKGESMPEGKWKPKYLKRRKHGTHQHGQDLEATQEGEGDDGHHQQ